MRPLFPGWLRDDLQVVATCLSLDERVPADVLAVTGASIATLLAGILQRAHGCRAGGTPRR